MKKNKRVSKKQVFKTRQSNIEEKKLKNRLGQYGSELQPYLLTLAKNTGLQIILLIFLPVLVFLKVVNFEFILDDIGIIRNNVDVLSNLTKLGEAFTRDAFFAKPGKAFYRPIQTVSFMFDASISGPNPWMYHFTNVMLHIITVILLYYILKQVGFKFLTPFFTAAIFSLHPLLTCAICWVPGRGDLLIGLFGAASFLMFFQYFKTKKNIYFIGHLMLFLIAMFSKETAIMLPVLFIMEYFVLIYDKFDKVILRFIAGWSVIVIFFFFVKNHFVKENLSNEAFGFLALFKNISYFPVIISKLFLPVGLPIYPFFGIIWVISGIFIVMMSSYYVFQLFKNRQWLPLFGIAWFILFILPPLFYRQENFEYVIINLEQRAYMPLVGMAIVLAYALDKLFEKKETFTVIAGIVLIILSYSVITYSHAEDYRNAILYANAAIDKNPGNAGAYTYLGVDAVEKQNLEEANMFFTKAIDICQFPMACYNRGAVKAATGDLKGAEDDFNLALSRDSTMDLCYKKRGQIKYQMGRFDEALTDFYRADGIDHDNPTIFNLIGRTFIGQKKFHEAIEQFTKAIKIAPAYIDPYEGRSIARFNVRDFEGAVRDCERVLLFRPNDINIYRSMGQAYREMKQYGKSINAYSIAIAIDSTNAAAYFGRGLTKQYMNDEAGWRADWNMAGRYGYMPPQSRMQK